MLPAWLVSRALSALRRLSADADEVDPQTPDRRLRQTGVDRGIQPLVTALKRALDRLAEAYERQQRFAADAAR